MTTSLASLDFGPALGDSEISDLASSTGGSASAAPVPADPKTGLAYDVAKWDRMLYEKRRIPGATLDGAVRPVEVALGDHAVAGKEDTVDALGEARELASKVGDALASEIFSRLYGSPEKREQANPVAPWAPRVHEILDQLPEFAQLRDTVQGDPDFSALAAADVLAPIAAKLPELLKEVEEEQEREQQDQGEQPSGEQPGPGQAPAPAKRGPSAADKLRAALRGGLATAAQKTGERKESLAGLAPGLETAPPSHEHPDATRMNLIETVAKDASLREVLRRAGRLRRVADRRRQERRSLHAREEVVDLERGNDIARILPAQLAGLRHSGLRKLALLRIAEGTAIQYRLEGKEPQGRGPIVVLLDRSGSMSGSPNQWASAVGVACMGIAAREHRPTTVIEFNGSVVQVTHVAANGLALDIHGKNGINRPIAGGFPSAMLRIAGAGAGGGTDYDKALAVALDGLPNGLRDDRADLVFVTDGQADVAPDTLALLTAQKKNGLRIFGLCVNGGSVSGAVLEICDHVVDIDRERGNAEVLVDALPV